VDVLSIVTRPLCHTDGASGSVRPIAWSFLTNHAEVLLCVARQPDARLRDIASCVGITERAAHRIICDLEDAGHISKHRHGARNSYDVHPERAAPDARPLLADLHDLAAVLERDGSATA